MTLISIIVPIYNQENYLSACLDTLFSQANEEIEIILINDGSTDRSSTICKDYLDKYPVNATLIEQENKGLIKTREIGASLAKGEYVLFVDSDDILLSHAIEKLTQAIQDTRPDIILFNATNDLQTQKPLFDYPFENKQIFTNGDKYVLYHLLSSTAKLNNIWAKCIKHEQFENPEIYQDSDGISNGEDLYQSLVLIDKAKTIQYLDEVLYCYRVNSSSMSRSYQPKHYESEKKVCKRRLAYARKWGKADELEKAAEIWISKILRDVSRKLFLSQNDWQYISSEFQKLRNDEFYQTYYLHANCDPNIRDYVLKSNLHLMHVFKKIYAIKGFRK